MQTICASLLNLVHREKQMKVFFFHQWQFSQNTLWFSGSPNCVQTYQLSSSIVNSPADTSRAFTRSVSSAAVYLKNSSDLKVEGSIPVRQPSASDATHPTLGCLSVHLTNQIWVCIYHTAHWDSSGHLILLDWLVGSSHKTHVHFAYVLYAVILYNCSKKRYVWQSMEGKIFPLTCFGTPSLVCFISGWHYIYRTVFCSLHNTFPEI